MNYLNRALLGTFSAGCTFVIVDDSHVVVHVYSIKLTLLCAEGAAYTSGLADVLYLNTSVVG